MKEKMVEMFKLQERLNDNTNGFGWRDGATKQGKIINWKRCIVMESAELIDSFSWKHWKDIDSGIDLENIKIEMVDIWHFVMSYLLRFQSSEDAAKFSVLAMKNSSIKLPKEWSKRENSRIDEILKPFEELMALALIKRDDKEYQKELVGQFWECVDVARMSFDDVYRLYIGKNALNQFRQQHGYKEGNYKKLWNEKEDNVIMQEILNSDIDISYEKLLDRLESIYATL